MKKLKSIFLILALFFACSFSIGAIYERDFIATAIDITAGATSTNGSEFTSRNIWVNQLGYDPIGAITITFTRAAGAADTVNFKFEVSYDDASTWATFENADIEVATNHAVISGTTVVVTELINSHGITHIRLKSVENSDGVNNITSVNATWSMRTTR